MRWTSTHESVEREEVSALALVETAMALGLSYAIYAYTGSLRHVGWAASIAPFLLLRTNDSIERGLRFAVKPLHNTVIGLFDPILENIRKYDNLLVWLITFVVWLVLLTSVTVISIICNILATIYTLYLHPSSSLSAIPENWRKVIFCTDMQATPELLPGIERDDVHKDSYHKPEKVLMFIKLSTIIPLFSKSRTPFSFMLLSLFAILIYIPAAAYRWSLKSTALIWSPLLWVVRPAKDPSALSLLMKRIVRGGVVGISRLYSGAVVLLFAGKVYLWYTWAEVRPRFEGTRLRPLFDGLVVPQEIPPWQLAAVASGVVTWVLFWLAKYHLQEIADGGTVPEEPWRTAFTAALVLRNFLAVYTGLCAVYILWSNLDPSLFPPLGTCLSPWSCGPAA